ncbi:hypothetical protein D3C72_769270 [compost metagenome]
METARDTVVVEELLEYWMWIVRQCLWQGPVGCRDVTLLVDIEIVIAMGKRATFCVLPALFVQVFQYGAAIGSGVTILAIAHAMPHGSTHVIHHAGRHGFDASIGSGGIEGHATPATDAQQADTIAVDLLLQAEKIDGGTEVFGVDVGGGHVARLAATFAGVGGVKRQGDETVLGQGLGIETARLLLHRAKGAAQGNRGELGSPPSFRQIEVSDQGDAITVLEGHLAMLDFVALGKGLVPLGHHGDGFSGIGSLGMAHRGDSG